MQSASASRVSVTWQNSSSRWKSAEFRASRDASSTRISPASPWQTLLTTSLKSARSQALRAEVAVEHHDLRALPAQSEGGVCEGVLAQGRFGVLPHLGGRRLPDVDQRQALPVARRDLVLSVHRAELLPGRRP